MQPGAEDLRLASEATRGDGANWKRWGTYLGDRQWGTVREDYSHDGEPWHHFTHDQATWRAYRWGEDGILGWTDRQCRLCFSISLWNGKDPILKERLFGLSGPEGNHGEDVKECYYYLDALPTHSYARGLYKYPQAEFPYQKLVEENLRRSRLQTEYELTDTGIFDDNKYFDVSVEYCKAAPEDTLIRITIANRGPKAATLHLLPTFWFRNTWSQPNSLEADVPKPSLTQVEDGGLLAEHATLGNYRIWANRHGKDPAPNWLFTENETNPARLAHPRGEKGGFKDAFHLYLVHGIKHAIHPQPSGTKAAAHYLLQVAGHSEVQLQLRMAPADQQLTNPFGESFQEIFSKRLQETDEYFERQCGSGLTNDERRVMRQASAGLFWTKQFYFYSIDDWLKQTTRPPYNHKVSPAPRNADWGHLVNRDVISMPDKWEYPWYAAWDSAFHVIPFAQLDIEFAKEQLIMFLREWYMHPNGQIPAYEWNFSDVNPPVHAWACWRTYQQTGEPGKRDRVFLSRVFQKLLLNFTWWVNRKDVRGRHIFTGGFLGLDNIGVFDRSKPLPTGGHLEQADGTAWMAYYCSSMLSIALELADGNPAYADTAYKFFAHYISISEAMNSLDGSGLWDETDGFYYDHIYVDGRSMPVRIRSIVGLIPLLTVDVLYERVINQLPEFRKRVQWLRTHRRDLESFMTFMDRSEDEQSKGLWLLAVPTRQRLERMLSYLLDEQEFLSPYGIRSLSKYHQDHPFRFNADGEEMVVRYVPGESETNMFGGNSNWRGPIWFPLNYLIVEALERYHEFYGDTLKVECPTGSGNLLNLGQVAQEIRRRLVRLFLVDSVGNRPSYARNERFLNDPHWNNLVLFYEYFHGDSGRGLGASHQTGWTALVAPILAQIARSRAEVRRE
ncbi:MGH1-like glycoside hydrolase domain-containing protein [Planctomicrobium sp. SH664]|uniref:MGH1-like glycoside hydrolase domain-containing protein n=1 Tax=Planctomicrobium sp. SH664 TaxID=3448125 RepID=UPI003F5B9E52